ncbi:MAG: hypothetical protein KIS73_10535 [Enhydrobacter sp.]|nr:hypothetical protein [Enhydrobacter sp.]
MADSRIGVIIDGATGRMPRGLPVKPAFRQSSELFLRPVGEDAPSVPTLDEGATAVQLSDLAHRSVAERRWIDVPQLRL